MSESNFVDAVLAGSALAEDVDDWVDQWHDAEGCIAGEAVPIWGYLGMTRDEYALWVEQDDALRFVIAAHRYDTPVDELLVSKKDYALAARAQDSGAAEKVLNWLIRTGRVGPEQASHA
ncbi:hypothetical protein J2W56_001289 [Nocardia kruczakiae]|uniref:Uncharacterized protein n=1 Tax=Nocardia kruczakiae TaxID=261477 RepID=A0ABU1XAL6_9NOCA|nr:hypothetical protein [Nocardia kruczakiae]MDR7167570.1 hypothetical protein [Nocardia kruczakiae]